MHCALKGARVYVLANMGKLVFRSRARLVEEGQEEDGIAQMRQRLAAYKAMGAGLARSDFLPLLAEACA